ncbi:MAG: polysaccharide deacetylase family protein [Acidobacteria bacterium]|nr:polysaccharide deacetylase family protein [Acidobacteriota bacterium]
MRKYLVIFVSIVIILPGLLLSAPATAKDKDTPPVYVVFWFDYEDYISGNPSNEAAIRIAEIMRKNGVKAVFKVVGMKAEEIEKKGLSEVISALAFHEVGFHSYNHSIHPTIGEYLKGKGFAEGVAEFKRREEKGELAVRRVFGRVPICYGQPGSAWAPQVYPVLREWGIKLYLDEGDHIGIDNQPFWYLGVLNIYRMRSTVIKLHALATEDDLKRAEEKAKRAWSLLRKRGGGVISTYSHPLEFVTKTYWDRLNFKEGKNTPPGKWVKPPLRSKEEIELSFRHLDEYTKFLLSLPGVRSVSGSELLHLYRDLAPEASYPPSSVLLLARSVVDNISFVVMDGYSLSPGEVFSVLVNFFASYEKEGKIPNRVKLTPIFEGPTARITTTGERVLRSDFCSAVNRLQKVFSKEHRIPNFIEVGKVKLAPADFLATLGWVTERVLSGEEVGKEFPIVKGHPSFERYVFGRDIWQWSVFPKGFSAPDLIELARLQAWTLKPAILHPEGGW